MGPAAFRLGFACAWWTPARTTWSGTPWALRSALTRQPIELVPIDSQRPLLGKAALRALYASTNTPWKYSRLNRALTSRVVRRQARRTGCDAVITTADDDSSAGVPTFAYQDMNFSVALEHFGRDAGGFVNVRPTTREVLTRLSHDQRRNYDDLTGIFPMAQWFADWLVERQGLPREQVHVMGAGINHRPLHERRPMTRGHLLFVGADFHRKAGDQVVAAAGLLRGRGEDVTLTIVGPERWPLDAPPPPWIRFVGYARGEEVPRLWPDHDLLVVPSRFEAYGIIFSEALAAGLPCVGRRAFAMPELIGDCGVLIEPDGGPEELAAAILAALSDDALYERVWQHRPQLLRERSWDAVAGRMVEVLRREKGRLDRPEPPRGHV